MGSRRLVGTAAAVLTAMAVAVAGGDSAAAKGGGATRVVAAKKVVRVVPAGKQPVLLEGGTFGSRDDFYFANVLAAPGMPKVLRLNVKTKKLSGLYTDKSATFTSTQFSPSDGRLYLTDYEGGTIDSMKADGSDFRVDFGKPIHGARMVPDDIAFDAAGNLFVTDAAGTPWDPSGRLIRFDEKVANPSVLLNNLAAPNGVSFSPDESRLWVSEYNAGREDSLLLADGGKEVETGDIGMRFDTGVGGFDSNSVDAAGNVYQCLNELGEILVWNTEGELLEKVRIPQNLDKPELSATNLAIRPGTREAFVVVGGEAGGFVYEFKALAAGIMPSNGGGALPRGS